MYFDKKLSEELTSMCDNGLSMQSVAESIGIHPGYMRQIKLGTERPSKQTFNKIRKEVIRRVRWLRKAIPEQRILRKIYREANPNVAHIARLMGCSRQAVHNYLNRDTVPLDKLEEVSQIYLGIADAWEAELEAFDMSSAVH